MPGSEISRPSTCVEKVRYISGRGIIRIRGLIIIPCYWTGSLRTHVLDRWHGSTSTAVQRSTTSGSGELRHPGHLGQSGCQAARRFSA